MPAISLAECGIRGWEVPTSSSLTAAAPPGMEMLDAAFAVFAVGDSLRPFGIQPGFLLFRAPALTRPTAILYMWRTPTGAPP